MLLKYYDVHKPDYQCLSEFYNREKEYSRVWTETPLDQQVFLKYETAKSVGCGHYIRGCKVCCEECKEFAPCRVCHDDDVDHEFPRYKTQYVRCNYCN